jgi:hypothetical protein
VAGSSGEVTARPAAGVAHRLEEPCPPATGSKPRRTLFRPSRSSSEASGVLQVLQGADLQSSRRAHDGGVAHHDDCSARDPGQGNSREHRELRNFAPREDSSRVRSRGRSRGLKRASGMGRSGNRTGLCRPRVAGVPGGGLGERSRTSLSRSTRTKTRFGRWNGRPRSAKETRTRRKETKPSVRRATS